tara:strand:- start:4258 stop:5160 length:903 start_codon:yes stop_codon:yes gene_type:complete
MSDSLKTDNTIDKHLHMLKTDSGEVSSLSVSTEGNGAKITGDLDIKGDTIITGSADIVGNTNIKGSIEVVGKIKPLHSILMDGKKIHLDDGNDTYIHEVSADKLEIVVGADEMITLDEANQRVTIEADKLSYKTVGGTNKEFSPTDSAYAGMILGYTCLLNDAADTSYTVTTSFATIHSTTNLTFIAPPSGNVEIFASVFCKWTSTRWLQLGLSDNATYNTVDVTHEHYVAEADETDHSQINHQWVITGLTAGTSYTYWLGALTEQVGRVVLHYGGDNTGEYAPFIMKATALPATIYDGT